MENAFMAGDKSHLNEFERESDWKILRPINMLFKRSRTLVQSGSFYIGLQNKQSYGIFFDNTFRTYFDFVTNEET
jgi:alpha-glucosidase